MTALGQGTVPSSAANQLFVHPGILQNQGDLNRMNSGIMSKDPVITAGFEVFRNEQIP